ncbi:hypothetical protein FRB94_005193 [Tulasnella sp. JGI-2019a]|nr:hypothetical protein FRB94_005193 [Tulasnella sp. JGI-2019a]
MIFYSNVTVIGAHNTDTSSNTNLAANQDYGVTQQLTDVCHTSCLLHNGGSLSSYLAEELVKAFLDANPNEVATLLLVNSDDQPAPSFASACQAVGVDIYAWYPTTATVATNAWPM